MKQQIDKDQLLAMVRNFPPSPRDRKITLLGIASFIFYALAGFCAWKFGGWWGIGLVVCVFFIDVLTQLIHNEYREELIEMHGELVRDIAENSDILDNIIPKKNRSTRSS